MERSAITVCGKELTDLVECALGEKAEAPAIRHKTADSVNFMVYLFLLMRMIYEARTTKQEASRQFRANL